MNPVLEIWALIDLATGETIRQWTSVPSSWDQASFEDALRTTGSLLQAKPVRQTWELKSETNLFQAQGVEG